ERDAVPVCIGLDHRPDARAGRGLARTREVRGERIDMGLRGDRARHGSILPAVRGAIAGSLIAFEHRLHPSWTPRCTGAKTQNLRAITPPQETARGPRP